MAIPACFLPNRETAALMRRIAEGHHVTRAEVQPLIKHGLARSIDPSNPNDDDFGLTVVGTRCLKRVDPSFDMPVVV